MGASGETTAAVAVEKGVVETVFGAPRETTAASAAVVKVGGAKEV